MLTFEKSDTIAQMLALGLTDKEIALHNPAVLLSEIEHFKHELAQEVLNHQPDKKYCCTHCKSIIQTVIFGWCEKCFKKLEELPVINWKI